MFGIVFAVFCGLLLARIWRRPRWGMHACGGHGPMHPMARGHYHRCGGPPWSRPPFDGEKAGGRPSSPTSSAPGNDATPA